MLRTKHLSFEVLMVVTKDYCLRGSDAHLPNYTTSHSTGQKFSNFKWSLNFKNKFRNEKLKVYWKSNYEVVHKEWFMHYTVILYIYFREWKKKRHKNKAVLF